MGKPVLWTAHVCVVGVWGHLSQDVYKLREVSLSWDMPFKRADEREHGSCSTLLGVISASEILTLPAPEEKASLLGLGEDGGLY